MSEVNLIRCCSIGDVTGEEVVEVGDASDAAVDMVVRAGFYWAKDFCGMMVHR